MPFFIARGCFYLRLMSKTYRIWHTLVEDRSNDTNGEPQNSDTRGGATVTAYGKWNPHSVKGYADTLGIAQQARFQLSSPHSIIHRVATDSLFLSSGHYMRTTQWPQLILHTYMVHTSRCISLCNSLTSIAPTLLLRIAFLLWLHRLGRSACTSLHIHKGLYKNNACDHK